MVRAILEERKTMTRRIAQRQPNFQYPGNYERGMVYHESDGQVIGTVGFGAACEQHNFGKFPYGGVGDVLWVREEHYRYGQWKKNGLTKTGRQKWKFCPDSQFNEVRYFDNAPLVIEKNSHRATGWYKRLARFMPRSACRLFLEITDFRAERLQEISEADAKAEGVQQAPLFEGSTIPLYVDYLAKTPNFPAFGGPRDASRSFKSLWQKINGIESWNINPFVWVVSFNRINKPENF